MRTCKVFLFGTAIILLVSSMPADAVFAGDQAQIRITSPANGAKVPERPSIEGTVNDEKAEVWVIVHPVDISTYWVQPSVTVNETGKWKVKIYIGNGNEGKGEQFEVLAIKNPKHNLKEGDQLNNWPEAEAKSQVIEVTRK